MNSELAQEAVIIETPTKVKVGAAIAVTAYLGACYAGGFLIGKLVERKASKVFIGTDVQVLEIGD